MIKAKSDTVSGLAVYCAGIYGFLYLPLAVMFAFSFNDARHNVVWTGFTLKWYGRLFQDAELLGALGTSVRLGLLASLIASILGLLSSYAMARHASFKGRGVYSGLLSVPLMMPEVVMGVGLLSFFIRASTSRLNLDLGLRPRHDRPALYRQLDPPAAVVASKTRAWKTRRWTWAPPSGRPSTRSRVAAGPAGDPLRRSPGLHRQLRGLRHELLHRRHRHRHHADQDLLDDEVRRHAGNQRTGLLPFGADDGASSSGRGFSTERKPPKTSGFQRTQPAPAAGGSRLWRELV